MNSEKSMNSFKMKKGYLIIYWKIFFFFYEQSVPPTSQNTFDYDWFSSDFYYIAKY